MNFLELSADEQLKWVEQKRAERALPKISSPKQLTVNSLAKLWSVTPIQVLDGIQRLVIQQGNTELFEKLFSVNKNLTD